MWNSMGANQITCIYEHRPYNQIVLTVMKISFHFNSCGVVFGVYCTLRRLLDCDHVGNIFNLKIPIDAFKM